MSEDKRNPILAELTAFARGTESVEQDAAKRDEFRKAFAIPDTPPTLHQRLIGIEATYCTTCCNSSPCNPALRGEGVERG